MKRLPNLNDGGDMAEITKDELLRRLETDANYLAESVEQFREFGDVRITSEAARLIVQNLRATIAAIRGTEGAAPGGQPASNPPSQADFATQFRELRDLALAKMEEAIPGGRFLPPKGSQP